LQRYGYLGCGRQCGRGSLTGSMQCIFIPPWSRDDSWDSCAYAVSNVGMLTGKMPCHRLRQKTLRNQRKKTMLRSASYLKFKERKLCLSYTKYLRKQALHKRIFGSVLNSFKWLISKVSFGNKEEKIYLKVPVGGDGCPGDWQ